MDPVMLVLCLLGGAVFGAIIGWLLMKAKTAPELSLAAAKAAETDQAKADLNTALQEKATLVERASRVESLESRIKELEVESRELIAQYNEARARLDTYEAQKAELEKRISETFSSLAGDALDKNSKRFLEIASQRFETLKTETKGDLEKRQQAIDNLIKPIQESIKAVGEAAKEMETKREKAFGAIEEQLKQAAELAADVARQTGGLKDALKRPHVRGRWGEVQLRNCIELAGMEEHCDVEFQVSSVGDDEQVIRPDMIVRMPGGRRIAVDAKTPMDPFIQFIDATTEEERNAAVIRHGRAVRSHVARLAESNYMQKVAESPDFVVMFLPNESFLAMALEKEPVLLEEALNKKVLITTPGTLIGLLKVIRYGWNEEKIAQNAQLIANEGAKLNTELIRFLEDYARVGEALRTASDAYHDSSRRVEKQITNTSQKLAALGAKSKKTLSAKASRLLTVGEAEFSPQDEAAVAALPEGDGEGPFLADMERTPLPPGLVEAEGDGLVTHADATSES